jgi:hypothetical protein
LRAWLGRWLQAIGSQGDRLITTMTPTTTQAVHLSQSS